LTKRGIDDIMIFAVEKLSNIFTAKKNKKSKKSCWQDVESVVI